MNTESQQQIAREAAAEIHWNHVKPPDAYGQEEAARTTKIILSAIERAREAEIKTFLPMVKAEIAAAQPQRREHLKECSAVSTEPVKTERQPIIHSIEDSLISTPQRSEQQFIPPPTGAQLAWQETVSEQQEEQEDIDLGRVPPDLGCKEWTPEQVKKTRNKATDKRNNPLDGDKAISDAHNAAITAERQRRDDLQLAYDELDHKCDGVKQQLIVALAAIEKAKRSLRFDCPSFVASEIANDLDDVDLSLLHERDAEVRKPLVDLLLKARLEIQTPMSKRTTKVINEIDDALAKIKNES